MYLFDSSKLNLDEVVFEPRNKAYGAYALRKSYPDHLRRGVYFTLLPMLFITVAAPLHHWLFPGSKPMVPEIVNPGKAKPAVTDAIELGKGFTFILSDPINGFRIVVDKKANSTPRKKQEFHPIETGRGVVQTAGLGSMPALGGGFPGILPQVGGNGPGQSSFVDFVEFMPEFPGGIEAMYDYIKRNLSYPRIAMENQVQGKVVISFVVMPDGSIQMTNLERGIGYGCDAEAMRVVNEMPVWNPGMQNGKKVPVRLMLPVLFQIN